jgi:hypothetical protein
MRRGLRVASFTFETFGVLPSSGRVAMKPLAATIIFLVSLWSIFRSVPVNAEAALGEEIQPVITTSELVIGMNRFAFGLLYENKLVENAEVTLRTYDLERAEGQPNSELKAPYQAIRKINQKSSMHRHADGTEHVHDEDSGVRGLYVARVEFSRAGTWGIELLMGQPSGSPKATRFAVTVLDMPATPAVGSAAPRSRNLIARDVKNLRQIDTSQKPDVRLHQVRIVDAIAQGKPQLVVFATPQFCTSRMCGPVVDIVRSLLPTYGKRVAFIHQEIWQDFAEKKMFPTVEEWRLDTEPWVFVVDGKGIIRAKFEGLVTAREIEASLQQILTGEATRPQ